MTDKSTEKRGTGVIQPHTIKKQCNITSKNVWLSLGVNLSALLIAMTSGPSTLAKKISAHFQPSDKIGRTLLCC